MFLHRLDKAPDEKDLKTLTPYETSEMEPERRLQQQQNRHSQSSQKLWKRNPTNALQSVSAPAFPVINSLSEKQNLSIERPTFVKAHMIPRIGKKIKLKAYIL
jgi:hypothetical protein